MTRLLRSLVFVMLLPCILCGQEEKKPILNFTVPDQEVKALDGGTRNLKDYAANGKITIFSFWATWCIPCKKELENIRKLYAGWQEKYNVELIAVSTDDARTAAKVKSTVEANGWPYEVLLDPNGDLKRIFNFQVVPHMVVLNQTGSIGYVHSGYLSGDEFTLELELEKMKKLSETEKED